MLTESGVKHALEKPWHGIRDVEKIKSAMRSIKEIGDNIKKADVNFKSKWNSSYI